MINRFMLPHVLSADLPRPLPLKEADEFASPDGVRLLEFNQPFQGMNGLIQRHPVNARDQ